jgi:TetR/AcrR family transcriptional regulator, cholesterol catabolism regulator
MVEITRRQAIEDVASDLFREHGYAATSIRDIARALSVQGASLYAHVTSKEDVLWAIVDRAATRFETAADRAEEEARAHRPGDAAEAIAALVESHVDVVTAKVDEAGVFMNEWRSLGKERRQQILERRDAYQARFRRYVQEGIAGGTFAMTDPSIATSSILSAINGVAAWYDPNGRLTAERIADHLVDLILRMLEGPR